ncbi:MAG: hypothetical protein NDI82_01760 [Anaeromyxobacteraceae bacterium]|nr:hypothetical protein [Anaeromyxobacteraceae bacterium]
MHATTILGWSALCIMAVVGLTWRLWVVAGKILDSAVALDEAERKAAVSGTLSLERRLIKLLAVAPDYLKALLTGRLKEYRQQRARTRAWLEDFKQKQRDQRAKLEAFKASVAEGQALCEADRQLKP